MPLYVSPLDSDSELQWDNDSYPNYAYNCGPASVEKVANYYKNLFHYGIERTRNLATSADRRGTYFSEQSTMLAKRGVPNDLRTLTPDQVKSLLRSARRPIVLFLKMSVIPVSIKGNSFNGAHSVAGLALGTKDGEPGIWVNEPNQRRSSSTYKAERFFPDIYWKRAHAELGRWALVPEAAKVIPTRRPLKRKWAVTATVLNIRSAPRADARDLGDLRKGATFTSNLIETNGGRYPVGSTTSKVWLGFIRNGRQVWVARGFCKEA